MYNQIIYKLIYSRRQLKKIKHFGAGHIHIATENSCQNPIGEVSSPCAAINNAKPHLSGRHCDGCALSKSCQLPPRLLENLTKKTQMRVPSFPPSHPSFPPSPSPLPHFIPPPKFDVYQEWFCHHFKTREKILYLKNNINCLYLILSYSNGGNKAVMISMTVTTANAYHKSQ